MLLIIRWCSFLSLIQLVEFLLKCGLQSLPWLSRSGWPLGSLGRLDGIRESQNHLDWQLPWHLHPCTIYPFILIWISMRALQMCEGSCLVPHLYFSGAGIPHKLCRIVERHFLFSEACVYFFPSFPLWCSVGCSHDLGHTCLSALICRCRLPGVNHGGHRRALLVPSTKGECLCLISGGDMLPVFCSGITRTCADCDVELFAEGWVQPEWVPYWQTDTSLCPSASTLPVPPILQRNQASPP